MGTGCRWGREGWVGGFRGRAPALPGSGEPGPALLGGASGLGWAGGTCAPLALPSGGFGMPHGRGGGEGSLPPWPPTPSSPSRPGTLIKARSRGRRGGGGEGSGAPIVPPPRGRWGGGRSRQVGMEYRTPPQVPPLAKPPHPSPPAPLPHLPPPFFPLCFFPNNSEIKARGDARPPPSQAPRPPLLPALPFNRCPENRNQPLRRRLY